MRILNYTWTNFLRTKGLSLATIGILAFLIFLIHILLLFQYSLNAAINRYVDRFDIVIYLKPEYSAAQNYSVLQLQSESLLLFENEEVITFVSQDDSLDLLAQRSPELVEILEGKNVIP